MKAVWDWLKHFWNDGPDLTQDEIEKMNTQGEADLQSGLQKMKIPPYGEPEKKK